LSQGVPPSRSRLWLTTLVLADVTVVLMVVFGLLTGGTGLFLWGFAAIPALGWIHHDLLQRKRERQSGEAG
jgi:4-hydroxybenzoate polyprenyltransferase